jgi:hypothetical protein
MFCVRARELILREEECDAEFNASPRRGARHRQPGRLGKRANGRCLVANYR